MLVDMEKARANERIIKRVESQSWAWELCN